MFNRVYVLFLRNLNIKYVICQSIRCCSYKLMNEFGTCTNFQFLSVKIKLYKNSKSAEFFLYKFRNIIRVKDKWWEWDYLTRGGGGGMLIHHYMPFNS